MTRQPINLLILLTLLAAGCSRVPSVDDQAPAMPDSYTAERTLVTDGLVYWKFYSAADTQRVHVAVVDLGNPALRLDAETSNDSLYGFERTSEIFARLERSGEKPLLAVNADFWHRDGTPVGMFVDDGTIWRGPWSGTGDRAGKTRSIFSFDEDNQVAMGLPEYTLMLTLSDGYAVDVHGVNLAEGDSTSRLYTAEYPMPVAPRGGAMLMQFDVGDAVWLPNKPLSMSLDAVVETAIRVRKGKVILAVPDSLAAVVREAFASSDSTAVLVARLGNLDSPVDGVLGGLPRLIDLVDGKVLTDPVRFAEEEAVFPAFVTDRHPRTAVGYDRDTNWLYLVVVDGRSETAAGMDLLTLAGLFEAWGCDLAVNFDGGGSTTMVVDGRVVNEPSDPTGERPVSNVLLVRER